MNLTNYEIPQITDAGTLKPISLESGSFPYNQLASDRRFEELIYSLYKSEIDNGGFEDYTSISLMNGVRDKGSDCCLTINGKTHGLIQCKKYERNYAKEDFGLEITKFALYYLLDNSLIADLNNFTYYISVSKGLVSTCANFIKDFNTNVLTETHLDGWISTNLKSPTLQVLELSNVRSEILNIFTKIRVKVIIPQDLDLLLKKPFNTDLVQLFFAVRTVTDNAVIEAGFQQLKDLHNKTLSTGQLKQELKTGSYTISSQSNTIGEIPDSHIERAETVLLYNWVITSCEVAGQFNNICLLAGGAGYGKTVIIKDLYERLNANAIPVLALKADKLYVSNFKELQEKINLSVPLNEFIDQCKQQFETLVIIIDQIDALSQSLSSERSFLDTYVGLIEGYKHDPVVRIIISVRYFDLLYDPALRPYKNIKTVEVQLLSVENVKVQLRKIGIADNGTSTQLLELLRIPNNLDVFSRIYHQSTDFAGVNSIQGLYSELWKIKVLQVKEIHNLDRERIKAALFLIAAEMYNHQKITVGEAVLEDYTDELKYLKSEQLVVFHGNELQFFHQSFYDYIFARHFVEIRLSLQKYLKKENQSILVRAALKMILNYLRETDPNSYLKQIKSLLVNKDIRFHIHHLILSTIAIVDSPSNDEKKLLQSVIKNKKIFFITFCEHTSFGWIRYFIETGLIEEMLFPKKQSYLSSFYEKVLRSTGIFNRKTILGVSNKPLENLALIMLQRIISVAPDMVLPILWKLKNKGPVLNLLYHLNDWNCPGAIELLESCKPLTLADLRYSKILEDIVEVKPAYVFDKSKDFLIEGGSGTNNDQHRKESLLKKLFEYIPQPMFDFLFQYFIKRIDENRNDYESKPLIKDYIIYDIIFDDDHLHGNSFLFHELLGYLKDEATNNSDFYKSFLAVNISSVYLSVQRAILYSYSGNEKLQRDNIFKSFDFLNGINALNSYDILSDALRLLLQKTFPHFKKDQVKEVIHAIEKIPVKDFWVFERDGKKYRQTYFGLNKYRYLICIPSPLMPDFPALKKEYDEYKRRYPDKTIIQSNHGRGGMVSAPLSSEAYEKMDYNAWLKSFHKFDEERGINAWGKDFLKGGLSEHAGAFKNALKKHPEKLFPVVAHLFQDFSIPIEYHTNGLEALVEISFATDKVLEFLKILIKQELKGYSILSSIRVAGYLLQNDVYDPEVMAYLFFKALNDPDPEIKGNEEDLKNEHLVSTGINSVRGAAAYRVTFVQGQEYENQVFKTLNHIAANDNKSVVAAILYRFAYLMKLNGDRAFELFLSILNKENHLFIIESAWSLSYLVNYNFARFIPFFNRVLNCELKDNEAENYGNILFGSYYHNYQGAKELLQSFLGKFPKIRTRTISNAVEFIHMNDSSFQKSITLLQQYVTSDDKEIQGAFHIAFLHMEHITFKEIYPFLKKYSHTDAICGSEYFLEYLLTHCHAYPVECLGLFERVVDNYNTKTGDNSNLYHYDYEEHAVNLIIGIYNSLRPESDKTHTKYQEKLLTLFDITLRDSRFKSNTDTLLEKIIY